VERFKGRGDGNCRVYSKSDGDMGRQLFGYTQGELSTAGVLVGIAFKEQPLVTVYWGAAEMTDDGIWKEEYCWNAKD
jgi:hypothetical protein